MLCARAWKAAPLFGLVTLAASSPAGATTAVLLAREELLVRSDAAARVTVGKAVSGLSEDGTRIVTRTELAVTRTLRGEPAAQLVVEQIGGTFSGKTQRIAGDAELTPGEDAIVFLRQGAEGRWHFTALSMSVYHIDKNGMASRDLRGISLMRREGDRLVPIPAPAEAPEPTDLVPARPVAAWQPLDPLAPRWPALPVPYRVNAAEAPASIAPVAVLRVEQGFATWSAPSCSVWAVQDFGGTTTAIDIDDGINSIGWIGSDWPPELGPVDAIIGFTVPTWNMEGILEDADTVFNAVGFCWNETGAGGCVDTLSIITHEEGHFLGLGHTDVLDATMAAKYPGGTTMRTLEQDDIDGVCALYPPGGTAVTSSGAGATGCQGCINDAVLGPCAPEQEACASSQACADFYDCIVACATGACMDGCAGTNPEGAALHDALVGCICSACSSICEDACRDGNGGAGGAGGGAGSGGAGADDGGCGASGGETGGGAAALAAVLGALAARLRRSGLRVRGSLVRDRAASRPGGEGGARR
jgi:hypothetical protein